MLLCCVVVVIALSHSLLPFEFVEMDEVKGRVITLFGGSMNFCSIC